MNNKCFLSLPPYHSSSSAAAAAAAFEAFKTQLVENLAAHRDIILQSPALMEAGASQTVR